MHVHKIIKVLSLKDNTGKELHRLHDVLQQHLRALKAMDKEPSASLHHLTHRDEAGSRHGVGVAEGKPGFSRCSSLRQAVGILKSQSSSI